MKHLKQFFKVIPVVLLFISSSIIQPVYADESEVYFSARDLSGIKPNVFFILDVSGSMNSIVYKTTGQSSNTNTGSRLDHLKKAMYDLLAVDNMKKTNAGFMVFSEKSQITLNKPIINSAEIDTSRDMNILSESGDEIEFAQPIYRVYPYPKRGSPDNGYTIDSMLNNYSTSTNVTEYNPKARRIIFGFRFDNILLKNYLTSGLNSADSGIKDVRIMLYGNNYGSEANNRDYRVYIDSDANARPLDTLLVDAETFASRVSAASSFTTCNVPAVMSAIWGGCDVTSLVREKVSSPDWKPGNAMTFYIVHEPNQPTLNFFLRAYNYQDKNTGVYMPYLKLKANKAMTAPNEATLLHQLGDEVSYLKALNGTATVPAMLFAAKYFSNIPQSGTAGPYHDNPNPSPIEKACQTSHFIVMSDGDANVEDADGVKAYTNNGLCSKINGQVITSEFKDKIGLCGRYLAYWMANNTQSTFDDTYIVTHGIGFGSSITPEGERFLRDISETYGKGRYYPAAKAADLADAFKEIVDNAINAGAPAMSGRVVISAESQYIQRKEAYYSIFTSKENDYWPGNLKGFLIAYVDYINSDGFTSRRPVLVDNKGEIDVDKDGNVKNAVLTKDGVFVEGLSSFWSSGDASSTETGGVVGQLPAAADRNVFTFDDSGNKVPLKADNSDKFTDAQLGSSSETERKALLNFIRGYEYASVTGALVERTKKIADGSRAVVSILPLSCSDGTSSLLSCDRNNLNQLALLAGNDGVLRGYNTLTGKAEYEFMPSELLPIINKIRQQKPVNGTNIRTHGLDGTAKIHHVDTNKNGYLDDGETAYIFVTAGRGGEFAYILSITSSNGAINDPILVKRINKTVNGFSKLGNTWSVPASGKIQIGTEIKDVFIFGGGYDPKQDDNSQSTTDTVGNALYIVDVKGNLIWSSDNAGVNMQYSIPASPAVLVNTTTGLITDIVVGDMGGQVWRFGVNNGETASNLITKAGSNGLVASIADGSVAGSRRFYLTPSLYLMKDTVGGTNKLSVSIGSGYYGHPLNKDTKDKLYVFFLPKAASSGTVINEGMLSAANTVLNTNGFYVELGSDSDSKGEKVITDLKSDFDRVVFNTYIPNTGSGVEAGCKAFTGRQRSYVYNLLTGRNMLQSAYDEIAINGLPSDVALYCSGRACTFITSANQLSATDVLSKGEGGTSSPLNIPLCGPGTDKNCTYSTGWTDNFDPEVKN